MDILSTTQLNTDILVQKAVLCICDLEQMKKASLSSDSNSMIKAQFALEEAFRGGSSIAEKAQKNGFKAVDVQFNPTEISFESAPAAPPAKASDDKAALVKTVKTVMKIKLIYEDVDVDDAFSDTLMSQDSFLSGVKTVVKQSVISHSITVKINGLLSLLDKSLTRNVVFCWGKMAYSGILQSAEAEYTMFNPSGNPIMGNVNLEILLNQGAADTSNGKYNNKAFDELFKVKNINVTESASDVAGKLESMFKFNM